MASIVTVDDIIISSALLIASTLLYGTNANERKSTIVRLTRRPKQTTDQSPIGDRAKNCRRIEMVSIAT